MFDKELIESYYRVAADLERYGREMLGTAEKLAKMADGMSETNVRDRSPETQGEKRDA